MAISIISSPPTQYPVAVSEALEWGLQPDGGDGIVVNGQNAVVTVTFPTTCTVPANGTAFKIWGYNFTIQDAQPYTANAFRVVTSGFLTRTNFALMMQSNVFFKRACIVTLAPSGNTVYITWKTCEAQVNFGGGQMVFTGLTATGATATAVNGNAPEYKDGYKIVTALEIYDPGYGDWLPVTQQDALNPQMGCASIRSLLIDYMEMAKRLVYTPVPDLVDAFFFPPSDADMIRRFRLSYGWIYREEDCQVQSGTFLTSPEVQVSNTAFEVTDVYRMRNYWAGHPDGLVTADEVRFLTNQPQKFKVDRTSNCWLWFFGGESDTLYPSGAKFIMSFFVLKYNGDFDTFELIQDIDDSRNQVFMFNVSPLQIELNTAFDLEDVKLYTVQIFIANAGGTPIAGFSEQRTYALYEDCDSDRTDLYFVTPPGGIGTIPVSITSINANQTANEIELTLSRNVNLQDQAKYGGRLYTNPRGFDEVSVRAIMTGAGEDEYGFFRSMKYSPERWLKRKNDDGTYSAVRFNVNQGSIQIFQQAEFIELNCTGFLLDVPVQVGKNLLIE